MEKIQPRWTLSEGVRKLLIAELALVRPEDFAERCTDMFTTWGPGQHADQRQEVMRPTDPSEPPERAGFVPRASGLLMAKCAVIEFKAPDACLSPDARAKGEVIRFAENCRGSRQRQVSASDCADI